jgi:uncharacterized membrane protein YczE
LLGACSLKKITSGKIKKEIARYTILLSGMFLSLWVFFLMIETELGAPSWDVLHLGLYQKISFLTLGQIVQGTGLLLILVSYLLGIRPDISSILNMIFVGLYIDLLYYLDIIHMPAQTPLRVLIFILGSATMGFGIATYLSTNMGAGPRDSLMVALHRLTGFNMGHNRLLYANQFSFLPLAKDNNPLPPPLQGVIFKQC